MSENHTFYGDESVIHFHRIPFNGSNYHDTCWMVVDNATERFNINNTDTSFAYARGQAVFAGLGIAFESIAGTILNLLIIIALLKNSSLRKEYLSLAIVSLAATDLLFSILVILVSSLKFFLQYEYSNI